MARHGIHHGDENVSKPTEKAIAAREAAKAKPAEKAAKPAKEDKP